MAWQHYETNVEDHKDPDYMNLKFEILFSHENKDHRRHSMNQLIQSIFNQDDEFKQEVAL